VLTITIKKKNSPGMQPPATPAWVQIYFFCDCSKSLCPWNLETCQAVTVRQLKQRSMHESEIMLF
jgi:hypothetical protein